jgi:hypothetical protein
MVVEVMVGVIKVVVVVVVGVMVMVGVIKVVVVVGIMVMVGVMMVVVVGVVVVVKEGLLHYVYRQASSPLPVGGTEVWGGGA